MTEVTYMADKKDDARMLAPEQLLQRVLVDEVGKVGAFKEGKKVLVIALDDIDGRYDVSFRQCGMAMSECIALARVAETLFLQEMGYLPDGQD